MMVVGYKKVFPVGLTLDVNIGMSFFVLSLDPDAFQIWSPEGTGNLGLGWSF